MHEVRCNNRYRLRTGVTVVCEREAGHEGSHVQRYTDWFAVWTDLYAQVFIFEPVSG